jgi:hypothetical protein
MKPILKRILPSLTLVVGLGAGTSLSAQTLYEEIWGPGGGALTAYGWTATGAVGYSGAYDYANTEIGTGKSLTSAVYMGSGTSGAIMGFFTTSTNTAASGFTNLPFTGDLVFAIDNQLQGGGDANNETARFLVQAGGSWFASATPIPGPTATGDSMDLESLTLNPSAANWISVSGIGSGSITFGSTPAAGLSSPITGAGVVFTLNNSSYQTFNYADFSISVPPSLPVVGTPSGSPNPAYALSTVTLTASASGAGPLHYQWQTNSDLSGGMGGDWVNIPGAAALTVSNTPPDTGSTYTLDYRLIVSNAVGSVTSAPLVLAVYPATAPAISTDTTPGSISTYAGGSASFSASFYGTTPISYQWQTDAGQSGTFTNIPGATATVLSLTNAQAGNAGNYRLRASSPAGVSYSTAAALGVYPVIYKEPFSIAAASGAVSAVGWVGDQLTTDPRIFTISGSARGVYSYTWGTWNEAYYATTQTANGKITNGIAHQAFPLIDVASVQNLKFFVTLFSGWQPSLVQSYFAVQMNWGDWYVAATPLPQPDSANTLLPCEMDFSPSAGNWNELVVSGTGSAGNASYPTIGGGASADLTGTITGAGIVCVHSGNSTHNFTDFAIGGSQATRLKPMITYPPFGQTNYSGATATFTVSALATNGSSAGLQYQWLSAPVGGSSYTVLNNGGQISGATSDTLRIANLTSANQLDYFVRVYDSSGSVTSQIPATLAVVDAAPMFTADTTISPAAVHAGNHNLVVFSAAMTGSGPMGYQWFVATDAAGAGAVAVAGWTNSTQILTNPEVANSGYYSLRATNSIAPYVISSSWAQFVAGSADTAFYHWSAPVSLLGRSAAEILDLPGKVLGAELMRGTGGTVSDGSQTIVFSTDGSVAAMTGISGPGTGGGAWLGYYSTGNASLDAILDQKAEVTGAPAITVNNLTAGVKYSVQLFAVDNGTDPTRALAFADPNDTNDVSQTYPVGDNCYVLGTFVATDTTATISQVLPTGHGYFGSLVVRQAPPTVSLTVSGANLQVSWDSGTLLQATSVAGPWTPVTGATSPYTVTASGPQMFFRASNP